MRFADLSRRGARTAPGQASVEATRVVHQAASLLLAYPSADLLASLPVIEAALAGSPSATLFEPLLAHLRAGELMEAQSYHVQEFDLSRRHALHLTYWTEGDTRRRGEVLASIKQAYRDSGLLGDTGGELPDYLPMMLEFAAHEPERGLALLSTYRPSLELLRLGLEDDALPHAGVLEAVCRTIPGRRPLTRAEVHALVKELTPTETVGLEPYPAFVGLPELQRSHA
ncbi:MAG: nitrate reductase molybdenum cofactor assembly chaperone [Micropruina sp.]|nr:MAG: nitrate reductase molybdenum cofactor assembly chaperone [Micropruina sp.]